MVVVDRFSGEVRARWLAGDSSVFGWRKRHGALFIVVGETGTHLDRVKAQPNFYTV